MPSVGMCGSPDTIPRYSEWRYSAHRERKIAINILRWQACQSQGPYANLQYTGTEEVHSVVEMTYKVYIYKRGLCCRPVSVCLSRWCIVSRPGWRYRQIFFSAHYSSFLTPSAGTQFQGEPLKRWRKIEVGWENFAIFDWNRRISRKRNGTIDPWLLWNVNRKS